MDITPKHYSYKFKFNIDKLPAEQKDRLSRRLIFCGIVFGLVFIALGLFEAAVYFYYGAEENYDFDLPQKMTVNDLMFRRYVFDCLILLLGIAVVTISVLAMRRYKTIFFDGENIKIEYCPFWGKKHTVTEVLHNYLGVLLRVEYYQLGLISRNRYIIELYHKDRNKRIPLYISTSGRKVRQMWESYAAQLKMPALFMTDHGLISRHHTELNKTLKDMAKKWHLDSLYRAEDHVPMSIKYKKKGNKVIIKERQLFFDIYSILAVLGIALLGLSIIGLGLNYEPVVSYIGWGWMLGLMAVSLAVLMLAIILTFSKDVLILTNEGVILGHNLLFLRMDIEYLSKENIAAVDIGHNPTTDRYYLSIISAERSIIFGKNMPLDDLRWVRGLVIKEISRETM